MLILNADDWGRSCAETDLPEECFRRGSLDSASGMVFMRDSERAAERAKSLGLNVGLHLNFTEIFSDPPKDARILIALRRVARHLKASKFSWMVFNPILRREFRLLCESQIKEYERLYDRRVSRIDGHQHMHLNANVILGKYLPSGVVVRRNFTFKRGERSWPNIAYRRWLDRCLAKRFQLCDRFYCLGDLIRQNRLTKVILESRGFEVEIMTHPARLSEFRVLCGSDVLSSGSRGTRSPRVGKCEGFSVQ